MLRSLVGSEMCIRDRDYSGGAHGLQYAVNRPWIPLIGVNYHVGADGLSVPMIFLTTLLTTISLIYSLNIKERVK